jgi:hypothetical protein
VHRLDEARGATALQMVRDLAHRARG